MQGTATKDERRVRSTRSTGRRGVFAVGMIIAALTLSAVSLVAGSSAPAAAVIPEPSPGNSDGGSQTPTPSPAEPPTITSPSDGALITGGSTTVRGTKAQGAAVQLSLGAGTEPVCLIPADDATTWSCTVSFTDGPGRTLRAVQTGTDGTTQTAQSSVNVLSPPVITSGAVSNGGIRGTGYPGAEVTVTASRGGTCTFTADASGSWFCVLEHGLSSGEQTVVATQRTNFSGGASSASSAPFPITIDLDPPAAPTITSPVVGTLMPLSGSAYTGTGEDNATVTVFAGSTSVCSAVVTGGVWTCTGGTVAEGPQLVIAIQQDAAGNTSGGSQAFTLRYTANPAGPSTPSSTPSPTQVTPAQPPVAPDAPGSTGQSPSPTPDQTHRPEAGGGLPAAGGGGPGPWAGATPFTASLSGSASGLPQPVWWAAAILALAALLLVAIPARLLASSVGPAIRARSDRRRVSVTGRNRAKAEFETAPTIRPPSTVAIAIATAVLASGFLILAHPVEGQPAYLRLWIASFVAIVLINAVTVGAQLIAARYAKLGRLTIAAAPRWVIGIGVVSLISRALGLQPALLLGLVVEAKPPSSDASVAKEGRQTDAPAAQQALQPTDPAVAGWLGLSRISAAALIGSIAWLVSALTGEPVGAFQSFLAEVVNVTAISGIGSAAIALLPIGSLGGLAVFRWSKLVWAASSIVAFTLLFALLGPTATIAGSTTMFTVVIVGVLVFAAVGTTAWVWTRHLRPLFEPAG